MPFHLAGWSQSIDSAVLTPIQAIQSDPIVRAQGNFIVVPRDLNVITWAFPIGTNITRARLNSPSLRSLFLPELTPVTRAANIPGFEGLRYDATYRLPVQGDEFITAEVAEDASGAAVLSVFIHLASEPPAPVEGEFFTIRATTPSVGVAGAWAQTDLTFEQSLPVGTYAIVGARCEHPSALTFRFVPVGGEVFRPGGISVTGIGGVTPKGQRRGGWGVWMEFDQLRPPALEVFVPSGGAAGVAVVYLDLARTGG